MSDAEHENNTGKREVFEALAESVRQADAGQILDAREAIRRLLDELQSR
jgi:hypothetical protein